MAILELERYLRTTVGVRHQLPPHLQPPYRGSIVDVGAYYHRHSSKDALRPLIGYEVPAGMVFVLDHISVAGNIFQSPIWWDYGSLHCYLEVNGNRADDYGPGPRFLLRACEIVGPDFPRGTQHDESPVLYCMNDISGVGLINALVNTPAAADPITRTKAGHSPVFGVQFRAEGPKRVFQGGDRVDLIIRPQDHEEERAAGVPAGTVVLGTISHETQLGCLNVGPGAVIWGFGVPAGATNNPAVDDGGLYGVGAFSGVGAPLLAAVVGLSDGIYNVAAFGPINLGVWIGGEQLGCDLGNPAVAGTAPGGEPHTVGSKNLFYVFLDRPSSQAELDLFTWQIGAAPVNAANAVWTALRVDEAIYRESPNTPPGATGGPFYWYEIRFTNDAVPPMSELEGFPLVERTHRYVKLFCQAVAPGVQANLNVTEVAVGFESLHPVAGRMHGWTYGLEYDSEKVSGYRVG